MKAMAMTTSGRTWRKDKKNQKSADKKGSSRRSCLYGGTVTPPLGAKKEKPKEEEKITSAVDKLTHVVASLAKLAAKATKDTQDSLRTVGAALMNM